MSTRLLAAGTLLAVLASTAGAVTVTYQQGVNGYSGTMDKNLVQTLRGKPGDNVGTLAAIET